MPFKLSRWNVILISVYLMSPGEVLGELLWLHINLQTLSLPSAGSLHLLKCLWSCWATGKVFGSNKNKGPILGKGRSSMVLAGPGGSITLTRHLLHAQHRDGWGRWPWEGRGSYVLRGSWSGDEASTPTRILFWCEREPREGDAWENSVLGRSTLSSTLLSAPEAVLHDWHQWGLPHAASNWVQPMGNSEKS